MILQDVEQAGKENVGAPVVELQRSEIDHKRVVKPKVVLLSQDWLLSFIGWQEGTNLIRSIKCFRIKVFREGEFEILKDSSNDKPKIVWPITTKQRLG